MYMADVGVAWVWLTILLQNRKDAVTKVTETQAVQQCSLGDYLKAFCNHRKYCISSLVDENPHYRWPQTITGWDPSHSSIHRSLRFMQGKK